MNIPTLHTGSHAPWIPVQFLSISKRFPLLIVAVCIFSAVGLAQDTGTLTGWGSNVGTGDPLPTYNQATPPDGNDFTAIDAGIYHSIALKTDGTIIAWGDNT